MGLCRAVIFDMDGVLIDSEPLWRRAEVEVFKVVGVTLEQDDLAATMGLRVDEVIKYWFARKPWAGITPEEVVGQIVKGVTQLILEQGQIKPGVQESIQVAKADGRKIALASSSPSSVIAAVLTRIGLEDYFDVIYSAEQESNGKPHPAVYLTVAQKLGVVPSECLAIEDSLNGVLSAKAANMKCIAIPDPLIAENPGFKAADRMLKSLLELTPKLIAELF